MSDVVAYGEGPDGLPVGRLPLLDDEQAHAAALRIGIDPAYLVQPIWRALLHRPKLAKAVYDVLTDLLFRNRIDARLREMLIMRIGWHSRSVFEWSQHWKVAERAGVAPDDILGVRDPAGYTGFDERDLAALRAADDVVERGEIARATWDRLTQHFDEAELLELAAIVTTWTWISTIVRSLDVPLDDGMSPWAPDGVGPA